MLHGFPEISGVKVNGAVAEVTKDSKNIRSVTFGWIDRETTILWN